MGEPLSGQAARRQTGSKKLRSALINVAKTAAIIILAAALAEVLYFFRLDQQSMILFFILFVLLVSRITEGYVYGILAAVLISLVYDFMVTDPQMSFSFTIGLPIRLFIMLIVTFGTSTLTIQMKKQAEMAQEREQRAQLFYEVRQRIQSARDLDSIIRITGEYLVGQLGHSGVFFAGDPLPPGSGVFADSPHDGGGASLFDTEAEREAAHEVYENPGAYGIAPRHGHRGEFSAYMSPMGNTYVPIVSQDKPLGVLGVYCPEGPLNRGGLMFMQMLATQVATTMELNRLNDEQNRILVESERDKTRAMLLRAISHDLRTPLTSILGDSSFILEQKDTPDKETLNRFLTDIKENAQWLIRIVENLLSVTRVSDETMRLHKTMEAAEEVVAQAVSIVRKRFPDRHIHVRGPAELLLVPMEATLISQVIINLLENSVKNSAEDSLILVDVKTAGDHAEFSVSDHGRGIPEEMLDTLFELHPTGTGQAVDSVRGMGIGLSICKTIITAHGGSIAGRNKPSGGALFSFSLPLKEYADAGK
ncbi:MAG: ATP-binding protein [Clostridiales bacterium]|nr:ATP-binding protein [Clostridiales bacterium]